jgi:hypothetical protein
VQVLAILTGQAPQLAARMFGNLASGIKPTKPEELSDCQQSSATQEKKSWAVREVALPVTSIRPWWEINEGAHPCGQWMTDGPQVGCSQSFER